MMSSKLKILAAALVLSACLPVKAGVVAQEQRVYVAYDREAITVAGTALGFTTSKINSNSASTSASLAQFSVNCASGTSCVLRYTTVGTATASVGQRALYGDTISVYGRDNVVAFNAIRETGTSVVIDVTYYR